MKVHLHIVHAKYLANRLPLVQALVAKLRENDALASVAMYTDKDPAEVTAEDVALFTNQPLPDGDPHGFFNILLKNMCLTQLSNSLKHLQVLRAVAAGAGADDEVHLVVEDDILFTDNVVPQLSDAYKLFEQMDARKVLFLGVPSPPAPAPTVREMGEHYKILPCCDSFFMDRHAATAILGQYVEPPNKIRFVNNIQLTLAMLKANVPIKIAAPHVFVDGSKFGVVTTNVELNNRLFLNPAFNKLAQAIEALKPGAPRSAEIDQMFLEFDFKSNPEYHFLKAKYETKLGNYHFAKAVFDSTYRTMNATATPMTQGSEFMREYMKLCKHLQDEAA